jgi:5'-methylthioadenosine phosphorylase
MRVGVITGTGTYALPELGEAEPHEVTTRYGTARVTRGSMDGAEIMHISRHGEGHPRLSNHVDHRANVAALAELGVEAVLSVTVCGAVDPEVELGSLILFDDLHFASNRLPDGGLCTFHTEPGDPARGHWIFERPFAEDLRAALVAGAAASGHPYRATGCYGHVDGPRFNSRAEIRGLAASGVTAVSQTAGPETVLCGEAEIPFALLGYATDYANGVRAEPTPVEELVGLIGRSSAVFATVLVAAIARLPEAAPASTGVVYRFES